MRKKLNETAVVNELRGASVYFPRPTAEDEEQQPSSPPVEQSPAPVLDPVRPVRPARRQMKRHPFDIYYDQLERLQQLSLEDRRDGGDGSMSRMVREALDRYLTEQGRMQPGE